MKFLNQIDNASKLVTDTDHRFVSDAEKSIWNNKLNITGGVMTGPLTAETNVNYTTRQLRNVIISTVYPTSSDGQNGDLWFKYD